MRGLAVGIGTAAAAGLIIGGGTATLPAVAIAAVCGFATVLGMRVLGSVVNTVARRERPTSRSVAAGAREIVTSFVKKDSVTVLSSAAGGGVGAGGTGITSAAQRVGTGMMLDGAIQGAGSAASAAFEGERDPGKLRKAARNGFAFGALTTLGGHFAGRWLGRVFGELDVAPRLARDAEEHFALDVGRANFHPHEIKGLRRTLGEIEPTRHRDLIHGYARARNSGWTVSEALTFVGASGGTDPRHFELLTAMKFPADAEAIRPRLGAFSERLTQLPIPEHSRTDVPETVLRAAIRDANTFKKAEALLNLPDMKPKQGMAALHAAIEGASLEDATYAATNPYFGHASSHEHYHGLETFGRKLTTARDLERIVTGAFPDGIAPDRIRRLSRPIQDLRSRGVPDEPLIDLLKNPDGEMLIKVSSGRANSLIHSGHSAEDVREASLDAITGSVRLWHSLSERLPKLDLPKGWLMSRLHHVTNFHDVEGFIESVVRLSREAEERGKPMRGLIKIMSEGDEHIMYHPQTSQHETTLIWYSGTYDVAIGTRFRDPPNYNYGAFYTKLPGEKWIETEVNTVNQIAPDTAVMFGPYDAPYLFTMPWAYRQ